MRVLDLTHTIAENMPVYPGTETPIFAGANTYEKDGFKETKLTMYTHTGTHMDPPAHLFADRATLDALPMGGRWTSSRRSSSSARRSLSSAAT